MHTSISFSDTIFSLIVHSPPGHASAKSAFFFATAVLASPYRLEQVFFFGDGVLCANRLNTPLSTEWDSATAWSHLVQKTDIALYVCGSSAIRRGVLSESEAKRYAKKNFSLHSPFKIAGLAQCAKTFCPPYRVLHFGR